MTHTKKAKKKINQYLVKNFKIGFWHPFGTHAKEESEDIIARKRKEIDDNNGWTLWSFKNFTPKTLSSWYREIVINNPPEVLVFCSEGKGAKNPAGTNEYCNSFCKVDDGVWQHRPPTIKIPHPFGKKDRATAFIVKQIIYPLKDKGQFPIEWYSLKHSIWEKDKRLFPINETLIRPGGKTNIYRYRAILVLDKPYLAFVSQNNWEDQKRIVFV